MENRVEIRLSGRSGQGIIRAGVMLAEAAVIYDDKKALYSQSYGPESRGGAAKSEVIISDGEIENPKVEHVDVLLALTQEAVEKYHLEVKEGGRVLVDDSMVGEVPEGSYSVYKLPCEETAKNELGKSDFGAIVAVGALVGITGVVSEKAIEQAVVAQSPKGAEDENKKALQLGLNLGQQEK